MHELKQHNCLVIFHLANCPPFAWEVIPWAILKDFKFAAYCSSLILEAKGGINFLNGSSARVIFPQKIASLCIQSTQQKARKIQASFLTFWSKIHPKGLKLALEGNLTPTGLEWLICVARFTHASQKLSLWLPHFDWLLLTNFLNNNCFKADLVGDNCLNCCGSRTQSMTSCQHEAIYVLKCPYQQSTAESFSVDNLPNVVHCFFISFTGLKRWMKLQSEQAEL